jgi:MFS superfamily sulfate permease-like transporter
VAFAEAIGPANEFARRRGGRVDPNRELVAIGVANTSAGLFSGFPIGSSLSKSAANDRAGARTPASLVTAAAATALVALFLTPLFEPLPEATLGAIVVVAVLGMMKVGKLRRLWELRRADFWLAVIALVGVLVLPTLQALGLAVLASMAVLIWRASEPRLTLLGRAKGGLEPLDLRSSPEAAVPGLVIVRPDEMLFFANAAAVRDGILAAAAAAEPRCSVVLLDLSLTPEVDMPVVEALDDLAGRLADQDVELWLSHLRPGARAILERAGVLETVGRDRIYPRTSDGLLAFALRSPGAEARVAVIGDVLAFVRQRAARPDTTDDVAEILEAIERRLQLELEAAAGAGIGTVPGSDSTSGPGARDAGLR